MSVNESKEFETINKKVKERSETYAESQQDTENAYRDAVVKRKAKACYRIASVVVALSAALYCAWHLEKIGWINATFRIVLMCTVGAAAMFKVGYFWHEFKY